MKDPRWHAVNPPETERQQPRGLQGIGDTRKSTDYPAWIDVVMYARWGVLVVGGLVALVAEEDSWARWIAWLGAILIFIAVPHILYVLYRREDPVRAEIVFKNDEDGYCNADGDGDGDGGGD